MHELVEYRSMKQLFLPVPLHTSIPLLSASVASSKSVVAGPIRMIKGIVAEILVSMANIQMIPNIFDNSIFIWTVQDLALSLSSCVYQCLCDSDASSMPEAEVATGMQGFIMNYFPDGVKRKLNQSESEKKAEILSSPKSWLVVSNLTKILGREQDVEAPKLKVLPFESLAAVYSSLLMNAFVFYDCFNLLCILSKSWNNEMWNRLFGGGSSTEYRYKSSNKIQLDENTKKNENPSQVRT